MSKPQSEERRTGRHLNKRERAGQLVLDTSPDVPDSSAPAWINPLRGYKGPPLPEQVIAFLDFISNHGFQPKVTGNANKTIRILHRDVDHGYVNASVIQRDGVLGYKFAFGDLYSGPDACPELPQSEIVKRFCRRYKCDDVDCIIHKGSGSNRHKTHLVITNPDLARRVLLRDARLEKKNGMSPYLSANDANDNEVADTCHPGDGDQRLIVDRQIRERRGQQRFRDALRERYGDRCMVTGCTVLDVVGAAHIKPYRGDNDNKPVNGLLLRADVHTLFDLDLLGIEPNQLTIELHPAAAIESDYKALFGKKLNCKPKRRPSRKALKLRYEQFQNRAKTACGSQWLHLRGDPE